VVGPEAAPGSDRQQRRPTVLERRFRAMSTDVHVIVVDGRPSHLSAAEAAVRDREARWSRFIDDSELSILNTNPGRPVVVSSDTFHLVAAAIDGYRRSGGRFDPTILRSLVAAGYDRTREEMTDGRPARHLPAPGPAGIELLDGLHAIVLPEGVGLDLGGIAKGATSDAVVAELLADGAAGCCVNIGGDLRADGAPPQPEGWLVELDCPGAAGTRTVRLRSGAVCTSTTLLRRWRPAGDDPIEHHLRDPGTGSPLRSGLASVSVLAGRAAQAEVLTKMALSAGPDGAPGELTASGVTGLLVLDDGEVVELAGFDQFAWRAAGTSSRCQTAGAAGGEPSGSRPGSGPPLGRGGEGVTGVE
jgi:thiamine biosynthesis lipoprotein